MNKLIAAWKSTNFIVRLLAIIALIDVIGYEVAINIEGPLYPLNSVGLFFDKISYSVVAAFIFYFITQRIKFIEDKILLDKMLDSNVHYLKESFTNLLFQIGMFGWNPIKPEKINKFMINSEDYKNMIQSLVEIQKDPHNPGLEEWLIQSIIRFREHYKYYLTEIIKYKEYYPSETIKIIIELNNKQFIEIAKDISTIQHNLVLKYLNSQLVLILGIQEYLSKL